MDGQLNYYPIELCTIVENQRVPLKKQTPDQMQLMVKVSSDAFLANPSLITGSLRIQSSWILSFRRNLR